jgi:hypothetical protein
LFLINVGIDTRSHNSRAERHWVGVNILEAGARNTGGSVQKPNKAKQISK